jgi:hypothetical protein
MDNIEVQGAITRKKKVMRMLAVLLATFAVFIVASSQNVRRKRRKRSLFYKCIIHTNNTDCHDQIRMSRVAFFRLASILKAKGSIQATTNITLEEQLVMFLHTLGHNLRNRKIGHNFGHSGETVSRYFHKVLKAIVALHSDYLKPPVLTTPSVIAGKDRFDPYFKVNTLLTFLSLLDT